MTETPSVHTQMTKMLGKFKEYFGGLAKKEGEHKALFAKLAFDIHAVYAIPGEFRDAKQTLTVNLVRQLKEEVRKHPGIAEFNAVSAALPKLEQGLASLGNQGILIPDKLKAKTSAPTPGE
jgi:hypothetical protein